MATVRASRRPKKISTSGRATWVERTRSCGAWKVATLSEKEWRSAAEETLRREGLVDVDDVERRRRQQPLDRVARADDRSDLVAAPLELLGDPLDELVDRVRGAPPVRA